jgi:lysophospholipid acyltransferase (LPLAT)-like uncharacterized protein
VVAARQETQVTAGSSSFFDRLRTSGLSWLGWMIVQFIGRTSRLDVVCDPGAQNLIDHSRPCLFAFWHRYQLFMVWEHRHRGVSALVSRSRDGELIAGLLHRFGFRTVRGSSSRGGREAYRELIRAVENGGQVAVTPDGPRGPLRSVQSGVLALAAKTGAPVIPLAWAGTRVKSLSSWDRFLVPGPFGRYVVVFGEPFFVTETTEASAERLKNALNRAEEAAQHCLRSRP